MTESRVDILIVDDEKIALKNLEHVMTKEGYTVIGTQSGAAGAETARGTVIRRRADVTSGWKRSTASRS
ncbi:MAG: hypothetical protein MZV70_44225 [Desulfobacterales bacterium]|nr:hypothetical protein [Desulfobacterales bacterium]